MIKIVISGAPRTKKNSRVHTKRGIPLPSKAFREWERASTIRVLDGGRLIWEAAYARECVFVDEALNCAATFYRDALRGDAVGYYQGLADLLEKKGVLTNDRQIVSWDGSRLALDRENPRTEVELAVVS